jgi:hypothetical protein
MDLGKSEGVTCPLIIRHLHISAITPWNRRDVFLSSLETWADQFEKLEGVVFSVNDWATWLSLNLVPVLVKK